MEVYQNKHYVVFFSVSEINILNYINSTELRKLLRPLQSSPNQLHMVIDALTELAMNPTRVSTFNTLVHTL